MARQNEKPRARGAALDAAEAAAEGGEQIHKTFEEAGERFQQTGERFQQDVEAGSRQFSAMGEQAFAAWMRSSNETLQRVLELNVELAAWSREQLDDNIDAVRSLAQCRSVGDAYGIQLGLVRSSMEKSLRHASNVLNLAAQAMTAGAQAAQRTQQQAD
jgi:hypothetical protein